MDKVIELNKLHNVRLNAVFRTVLYARWKKVFNEKSTVIFWNEMFPTNSQ